jgi:hypothetical protein
MQDFYFYTFYFFILFYFFWGWSSSAPQPVRPGHWPRPVTAEQHACANPRVLLRCASELKFTSQSKCKLNETMQEGKVRLPVLLETEDACSADGFSPTASLFLPSVLTCLRFLFVFSAAFETKKMMKRPACCEFVLILGLSLSAGTKAMAKTNTPLCVAPSLFLLFSVFFFVWFVLSVSFLLVFFVPLCFLFFCFFLVPSPVAFLWLL